MMSHFVELDESFENIGVLNERVQDQIGLILSALERDALYTPNDTQYLFQRDAEGVCSCRHISDWGDWQLTWLFEYFRHLPSTIQTVVVALIQEPIQLETLLPGRRGG